MGGCMYMVSMLNNDRIFSMDDAQWPECGRPGQIFSESVFHDLRQKYPLVGSSQEQYRLGDIIEIIDGIPLAIPWCVSSARFSTLDTIY